MKKLATLAVIATAILSACTEVNFVKPKLRMNS